MLQRFAPFICYETPDPAGSGGAAAVADPITNGTQPNGQGAEGDANGSDFWGMFPDVPEQDRALLEPHLRQHVLPYVTRMEQQLAPFKAVVNAGYTPDQITGLVTFSQEFDKNPLEAWLKMGAALQQPDPTSGQSVIHEELDLEILAKIAMGQELDDDGSIEPQPSGQGLPTPVSGLEGFSPDQQAFVQGLMQRVEAAESAVTRIETENQQNQTRAQEGAQQRLLTQQLGTMKTTLTEAGYPEELLTEGLLRSALITANGNAEGAIQLLQDQRTGILKGFTDKKTTSGPDELDLSGGTPKAPKREVNSKDGFTRARSGATAFLKRSNERAAQG